MQAPKTAAEMSQIAKVIPAPSRVREVPADIVAAVKPMIAAGLQSWGPDVIVTQDMVDTFTALTGDINPIHSASTPNAIVPGFLEVSLMPRLLPNGLPDLVPGRRMINKGFSADFVRPVPIGSSIKMRYAAENLRSDRLSAIVEFIFEIALVGSGRPVATGTIELRLV